MFEHLYQRFVCAAAGLWYALLQDVSFRSQLLVGSVVTGGVMLLSWPLSHEELLLLLVTWGVLLLTEIQNTAFENALDRLHPAEHSMIGRSKDLAAASVLLAATMHLGVGVVIILTRLPAWF